MKRLALIALVLTGCSGSWQLQENNDYFKPIGNKDEKYTQGLRLTNTHLDDSGSHSYYVGQSIYTPLNKQITTYQPDDRPYAGYLYGGYTASFLRSPVIQDNISVTAGVVGPSALGEQAQNETHRLMDIRTAKGWSNQLHDEPTLMLTAERQYFTPLHRYFDTVSTLGGNLGNVFTQAYAESYIRAGYNLLTPTSFAPIRPTASRSNNSYYVFLGGVERAVGRNIFLDGNTWQDSPSIGKNTFISEGRLGLCIDLSDIELRYTYSARTREYKGEARGMAYGEISITVRFDE